MSGARRRVAIYVRPVRRPGPGLLLLAALAVAGCGSTVQSTGLPATGEVLGAPGAASVDPLTGEAVAPAVGPGAGQGPGSGAAPVGGAAGSDRPTDGGGAPAPRADGAAPAAGASAAPVEAGAVGPGVDARTVTLGFQYVDVGAGTGGVLGQDVSLGDPEAQAEAVKEWINRNGGIAGRTLRLVHYGAPYANYVNNPQAEFNKICTYFTEDHEVLGVAVYVPDETLVRCLARGDVITVSDGYPLDRQLYSELAQHFYSPGTMSQDRGAEVGVAGHVATGFLKGSKIGLLRYDHPVYARAEVSLRKALAAKGHTIAERFLIDYSNTSKATSDAGAAVLRFRQLGITHVKVLDNSGGIAFAFMQAAENQGYRPYYALTTNNSPQGLKQLAPAKQLEKAQAVSWWWGDVGTDRKQQTPPALPRSRDVCEKIMTDAGVDMSGAAAGSSMITCDQLLLLKTLADRATAPSSAALSAAADALGSSYESTLTYRTTLGPGRRDGASVTRLIRFEAGCSCWVYAGPGPTAS